MDNAVMQKDWLKIKKMCTQIRWMLVGNSHLCNKDLSEALVLLDNAREVLRKKIEGED